MKKQLLILLIFFLANFILSNEIEKKVYTISLLQHDKPLIDGHLNDECWNQTQFIDDFTQLMPIEGSEPSEKTEFCLLYDMENIYVGVKCFDSAPDSIEALVVRRDDLGVTNSDHVFLLFDSHFDNQTAYEFGVNAAGSKEDIFFSEDANRMDANWDPVWDVKTRITDYGWCIEMRIPYSAIRFSPADEQRWGFNIYRKIYRKNEEMMWQLIPNNAPGFVSYSGIIDGIKGVKSSSRVELMPFATARTHSYKVDQNNPFTDGLDASANIGLDGKAALSSDFTLDFAINPDFGQVEADPSEVNLTAFESYFSEQRPFFVEGENLFNYPIGSTNMDIASDNLFYSRRIGRKPQYNPLYHNNTYNEFTDIPDYSTILGAAKLTGRTKNGLSVGLLNVVTNQETASISNGENTKNVKVEPMTNFFINRIQKELNNRNTLIGGIVTAVNRKIDQGHLEFLPEQAYSGGIDFKQFWKNRTYALNFKVMGSSVLGSKESIYDLQTAPARYFQRPDADYLKVDKNREQLEGHAGAMSIAKVAGDWLWSAGGSWTSPGFEINDIGYLRNADRIKQYSTLAYRTFQPGKIFRTYTLSLSYLGSQNFGGDNLYQGAEFEFNARLLNYWFLYTSINRVNSAYSNLLMRGGPLAKYTGNTQNWNVVSTDGRKDWWVSLQNINQIDDDGISKQHNIAAILRVKIGSQFSLRINPSYNKTINNLQYVKRAATDNGTDYVFGRIDQNVFRTDIRLDYSFTPKLSIQYFGQPFIASGKYSQFKVMDNPLGDGANRYTVFDESLQYEQGVYSTNDYSFYNPDFNFKEFLSNLVLRWEYRPGSVFYFVWNQTRDDFIDNGSFRVFRDLGELYKGHPNNIFQIKLSYWFTK